jgi:hypothetical protein
LPKQSGKTGNGRNAKTAGQDGCVTGGPAGLGGDAAHGQLVEHGRLRWANLRGHDDQRLTRSESLPILVQRELGHDLLRHVANVGHSLAQILVVDASEEHVVLIESLFQGRGGIQLTGEDVVLDFGDQGGIAKNGPVAAENVGRVFADLFANAVDGLVQFGGDGVAGLVESAHLGGQGGRIQ